MAKIIKITICLVLLAGIGFAGFWVFKNSNKVSEALDGTSLYSYSDILSAYNNGYSVSIPDKDAYIQQIEDLKNIEDSNIARREAELQQELEDWRDAYHEKNNEWFRLYEEKEEKNSFLQAYKREYGFKRLLIFKYDYKSYHYTENVLIDYDTEVGNLGFNDVFTGLIYGKPFDFEFENWSINGEIVDLTTFIPTEEITYINAEYSCFGEKEDPPAMLL